MNVSLLSVTLPVPAAAVGVAYVALDAVGILRGGRADFGGSMSSLPTLAAATVGLFVGLRYRRYFK